MTPPRRRGSTPTEAGAEHPSSPSAGQTDTPHRTPVAGDGKGDVQWHPAALVFPMLAEDELRALADDITANGLARPIELLPDGVGIDGRNRHAACRLAGVDPTFVTVDPTDPVGYVISANVNRRHMTTGARAMATAQALAMTGKRVDGRWKRGSVDTSESVSSGWSVRMAEAGLVLDHRPDLADQVVAGTMALDGAVRAAKDRANAGHPGSIVRAEVSKSVDIDAMTAALKASPKLAQIALAAIAEATPDIIESLRPRPVPAHLQRKETLLGRLSAVQHAVLDLLVDMEQAGGLDAFTEVELSMVGEVGDLMRRATLLLLGDATDADDIIAAWESEGET